MSGPRLVMGIVASLVAVGAVVAGWTSVRDRLRRRSGRIGPREIAPVAGWLTLGLLWLTTAAMVWWPLGRSIRAVVRFVLVSVAALWLAALVAGWAVRRRRAPPGPGRLPAAGGGPRTSGR